MQHRARRSWFNRLRGWRPSRSTPITIAALRGLVCICATTTVAMVDLTPIVVRSDSMAPAINRGDLVIGRAASAGDVVSVNNRAGVRVAHRVETVGP